MNIIVDTHILLWTLYNPEKLSPKSLKLIKNDLNIKYVSLASIWEIEIKHSIGKLEFKSADVLAHAQMSGFKILNIEAEHIYALEYLEKIHNDPFDRLLMCQARAEQFSLLTDDSKIQQYNKDYVIMN